MNEAYTAVIVRGDCWEGEVETEPYEAPWARECVVFIRALESAELVGNGEAAVMISPDGIHWVDEGTTFPLPKAAGQTSFAKLSNFGHFLKVRARLPNGWQKVMVTLALKG